MVYCDHCGNELSADSRFCSSCGNEVSRTEAANTGDVAEERETETGERRRFSLNQPEKVAAAGGGLAVIGAFLPWGVIFGQRIMGIDGDGALTLFFGIIAASVAFVGKWGKLAKGGVLLCGLFITFIGLYDMTNFAGSGIFVTILAGFVILAAPFSQRFFD